MSPIAFLFHKLAGYPRGYDNSVFADELKNALKSQADLWKKLAAEHRLLAKKRSVDAWDAQTLINLAQNLSVVGGNDGTSRVEASTKE